MFWLSPARTFSFDPATGYTGLVTGKPVAVVYSARRGVRKRSSERDGFAKRLYGFTARLYPAFRDIQSILVEPTLASPADVAKAEAAAVERRSIHRRKILTRH